MPTSDVPIAMIEGENTQYAGIPPDPRERTMTIITPHAPSRKLLDDAIREYGKSHLIFNCTTAEIESYYHFAPSRYGRLVPWLHTDPRALRLQFRTELQTRGSTLDVAVINTDRRSTGTVVSKARHYCRLSALATKLGVPFSPDATPLHPLTKENAADVFIGIKKRFIDIMEAYPWPVEEVPTDERVAKLTAKDRRKYAYLEWFKERLGDNLDAVVVYGSSATEDDPEKYSDFDNWVVVHDLDAAYARLRDTTPFWDTVNNEVVRGPFEEDKRYKHIGILLFPAAGSMFRTYMRALDDVDEFRQNARVILGRVGMPVPSQAEQADNRNFHTIHKNKGLADALTGILEDPSSLVSRKPLFEYWMKIKGFDIKNIVRNREGILINKSERIARLKELGMVIPPHEMPAGYASHEAWVADAMYQCRVDVAALHERFLADVRFDGSYFTGPFASQANL